MPSRTVMVVPIAIRACGARTMTNKQETEVPLSIFLFVCFLKLIVLGSGGVMCRGVCGWGFLWALWLVHVLLAVVLWPVLLQWPLDVLFRVHSDHYWAMLLFWQRVMVLVLWS